MSVAVDALFRHSRFFFAALILGAAPVLAVDILGGRILGHFTLYAVAQSAAVACLLTILVSRLRSRVLPAAILTLYGLAAIIDTAHTAMLSRPLDAVSLSLMLDTNPSEAGGFLARYITLPVVGRTLLVLAVLPPIPPPPYCSPTACSAASQPCRACACRCSWPSSPSPCRASQAW